MSNVATQILLPLSLFLIMLGIGLSIRWQDFLNLKLQKKAIQTGFFLQIFALPAMVFGLIHLFNISSEQAVAIMIIACCPGGVTSNAITYIFSGVVELSVTLTILSSLLAPLVLPIVTGLSLEYFNLITLQDSFSLLPALLKLLAISIIPLTIGNAVQHFYPQWCQRNQVRFRRIAGSAFLLVILLLAIANQQLLVKLVQQLGVFLLFMAVCTVILGYIGAHLMRLPAKYKMTLAIEVGVQNAGMGLIITETVLNRPDMSMILIAYGILMQIPILLFAFLYRLNIRD